MGCNHNNQKVVFAGLYDDAVMGEDDVWMEGCRTMLAGEVGIGAGEQRGTLVKLIGRGGPSHNAAGGSAELIRRTMFEVGDALRIAVPDRPIITSRRSSEISRIMKGLRESRKKRR